MFENKSVWAYTEGVCHSYDATLEAHQMMLERTLFLSKAALLGIVLKFSFRLRTVM